MIEPIGKRVAFRLVKPQEVRNGVVIPGNAAPLRLMGDVLYVGPDVKQTKVGDRIYLMPMHLVGQVPGVDFGHVTVGFVQEDAILGIERGDTEMELAPVVDGLEN